MDLVVIPSTFDYALRPCISRDARRPRVFGLPSTTGAFYTRSHPRPLLRPFALLSTFVSPRPDASAVSLLSPIYRLLRQRLVIPAVFLVSSSSLILFAPLVQLYTTFYLIFNGFASDICNLPHVPPSPHLHRLFPQNFSNHVYRIQALPRHFSFIPAVERVAARDAHMKRWSGAHEARAAASSSVRQYIPAVPRFGRIRACAHRALRIATSPSRGCRARSTHAFLRWSADVLQLDDDALQPPDTPYSTPSHLRSHISSCCVRSPSLSRHEPPTSKRSKSTVCLVPASSMSRRPRRVSFVCASSC